uniref:CST complex subunit CTC1 n=1 Tax=Erigeron canadensis TaxID=72917 RepID=UPI001CB8A079|nr:CST complex subunit CTC1 [Erigeron canadensis]
MEAEPSIKPISLSDLLHRRHFTAGASSLSTTTTTIHSPTTPPTNHSQLPTTQNPTKILKPLNHPSFLTGTVTLAPQSKSCSNPACLQFTDHTATICCDILDFDIRIICRRLNVFAWNFIPLNPNTGFLEIIKWGFDNFDQNDQSLHLLVKNYNGYYLNSVVNVCSESLVYKYLVSGFLVSVSPVTNVPCTANKDGTKNIDGFLAEIIVCECKLCRCKNKVMLLENIIGDVQNNDHCFTKSVIVYFCGSASVWYPAVSRMVGGVVTISGMKKKMVFLEEGKSLMMYVTTEKSVIHFPACTSNRAVIRRKGECNVYTGSITAVYMQGMVIELDKNVLLLLTDHQISMPHSLRIGALITVRNFHVGDPKFAWAKVKVFGVCYKTSIRVNVFSPMESRCYQALQSRSLLRKFIESLTLSARLWVLLVVSSLRKKFTGILSEMEILGSKHVEGLVQRYSSSCLPLSVFRFRHGVLLEYCLHELSGCGKEPEYNPPNLVVPVINLISQCESMCIESLYASKTDIDMNHQCSSLICGGKSHDQPIRKILKSKDLNAVLLGNLKICKYSGRLQFVDATGSIDVVIPDLPSVWSVKDIYEINDFSVVMEGFPRQLEHLELLNEEPFSCEHIFNHFHLAGKKRISIYAHFYMKDVKSRNHILCPSMDMKENFKELEHGRFHLLTVVHKFPVQQKLSGNHAVANNSSIYAEVIVLPWSLVIHNKTGHTVEASAGVAIQDSAILRKCTKQEASTLVLSSGFHAADCNLSDHLKCSNSDSSHLCNEKWCEVDHLHELNCTVANMQEDSSYKKAARKLLLEFKSDSFWKYESLRIGSHCLLKHHDKDLVCTAKNSTALVNSKLNFWNVSFIADKAGLTNAGSVDRCCEICPDINLHLSDDHLSFLEVKLRELKQDLIQPRDTIKGLLNDSWRPRTMMHESSPSGDIGVNLPAGNLLSVQGHVEAVHRSDQSHLATRLGHRVCHEHYHHHIVPGVTNSVCIHILVNHNLVKIYSSLSEYSYPIGFGPGVNASFHRVLLTAEGDVLKLTPVSFIEINSIVADDKQCSNEWDVMFDKPVAGTAISLATGPAALISEVKRLPDHKQMRLHCKVEAVYMLVVEKNDTHLRSFSAVNSEIHSVKIPVAGFIIDDGSSSCCCWTDNERALTLLGLHESLPHKRPRKSLHKSNKDIDSMSRISKILKQHGTVVMKNNGSVSDYSCLDIALSSNPDSFVSGSDEQFLKSLALQACSINTWNVVGTMLDSETARQIDGRLRRLDMTMPQMQNIWASEVSHMDTLNEARSILQELLSSF